ncbi:MAG: flagellar hook-associated protein FlgK [Phycisphaeraceae bacterium]|nr:flagellar hook-associated protein FlgK [Phycisphaerae bacterium]MBX3393046.1 flagellar hook-associated protein FlgK [Phycisphaeraceae bacterium]
MSLTAALNIGRSALGASQIGIQVAGNNVANVATPGYSRQVANLSPIGGSDPYSRLSAGRGVGVSDVRRQIDAALQSRLWMSTADRSAARQQLDLMTQVESVLGELSGNDLSSELSAFFNAWSERANNTQSSATVVQQGDKLAGMLQRLRSSLTTVRAQIDRQLSGAVTAADGLLDQVASLNAAISAAETSGGSANALRDQRDQVVSKLSELLDVSVIERQNGAVDVLVGSTPVVLAGVSRGIHLRSVGAGASTEMVVALRADGEPLPATGGSIAGLIGSRRTTVDGTIRQLDAVASQLIFQVNRLHSTGANLSNLSGATGSLSIPASDRGLAMNDPGNRAFSSLPFAATHGSFTVRVKNTADGSFQSVRVNVDLDGVGPGGVLTTAHDTSAEDIRAAIDGITGLSASFSPEGRLVVRAASGFEFSFEDDTSSALAVLGVNSYFTGVNGSDIAVRDDLKSNPSGLMSGRMTAGGLVENANAMAIVGLQDASNDVLGGRSIRQGWIDAVQEVGIRTSSAESRTLALGVVQESLEAQRASISGVSIDEEALNLMNFQRQYQGAARVISVADQLMQTLMSLV